MASAPMDTARPAESILLHVRSQHTPSGTEIELSDLSQKAANHDGERNEQPGPSEELALTQAQCRKNEWIHIAAICWAMFLAGYHDGSAGPLLPRIQKVYDVGYTIVSMIFVCSCAGFVTGAVSMVWITRRLGFGKTLALGAAFQVVAFAVQAAAPPFPAFVVSYVLAGFGLALLDAQANAYIASIKSNAEAKMGLVHAVYGVGAFAAPLVATQFANTRHWSFHYLISLGLGVANVAILIAVFRGRSQEDCLKDIGQMPSSDGTSEHGLFRKIMSTPAVHFLAIFVLVYVGIEVTIGGWIVTFVIDKRGGGPSAGYVSSGFWGGLALGRVLLLWINHKIGEGRVVFIYTLLCIGLEVVVWRVPSLIGNALAVSFIGVLLGPLYPIAMNQAGRVLPIWLMAPAVGWIAGFGQTGSAIIPFATGAIAGKAGISALQPLLVGLMAVMIGLWAFVPKTPRRVD